LAKRTHWMNPARGSERDGAMGGCATESNNHVENRSNGLGADRRGSASLSA
jgi:hypothetical protein